MKKLGRIIAHYLSGLMLACWKAGIHAVKLNGGIALAAATMPKTLPMPDVHLMVAIFGAAAFYQAIEYFDANPLPDLADVIDPEPPVAPTAPSKVSPQ